MGNKFVQTALACLAALWVYDNVIADFTK